MATWRRDGRLTGGQRLLCAGLAGALSLSLTAPLELATARRFVVMFTDDLGHISQWSSIMAGSLAGMVSTIVTYPTDLIKTRLIVQNMLEPSYRGLLHAFSTIYQQEGFLALYRGVSLTVVGALPFSAGSLLVHMNLEKIWNGPRDQFSLPQNFANVCLAAAVTQTLSFPFETVKRKMQAQSPYLPHSGGVDVHFSGAVDCFRQIVKAQGILGLWNGLTANLLKIAPYFGIMFSTFEFCKRICLYQNGYILSPLSYKLTPGVDQSLQPQELRELKKFFKTRKLKSKKPTL
ncbi:PREDICTED: solute carrier family 25 member 43 [Rhinopithecus bieti]|uniref:solute carrier family 25 member 43 n=1 Tax=Rhinopithecus bieti TaxID=61621 RepID=UPI00083C0165|nr:PREDICTED: solute carrier family 25 member 43 [Rhinopithecus bieti]